MPVKLTDKLYTEAGSPVQGANVQAILTNGTTTSVQATDTTDTKGVWAFDTSIAGHQADLPDPATGYWYDVKITTGMQYRLRYGAIKAMMSMVYLAQTIVLGAGQALDASVASLRLPVKAGDPTTAADGWIGINTTLARLRVYAEGAWRTVVTIDQTQTLVNKTLTSPYINTLGTVIGRFIVQVDPTATPAYNTAQLELQGTPAGRIAGIGFHELGVAALMLYKAAGGEILRVKKNSGPDSAVVLDTEAQTLSAKTLAAPLVTGNMLFDSASNTAGARIAFPQNLGAKISLYDGGGGNFFGFGVNGSELYMAVPPGAVPTWRIGNGAGTVGANMVSQKNGSDYIFDCGQSGAIVIPAGGAGNTALGYNRAFTQAPLVVCTVNGFSGSVSNNLYKMGTPNIHGVGTNGFYVDLDNMTGSQQTVVFSWMAFGR